MTVKNTFAGWYCLLQTRILKMKIEIDDNSVEELKLFIGMIIGKNIRGEDGLVANYCGDEFTGFPFLLENIYNQLDSANDED